MADAPTEGQAGTMSNPKKLTRSGSDRMVAGVAGGLGAYFGLDATLIRVLFVIFAILGSGIIIYLVCWILMPLET